MAKLRVLSGKSVCAILSDNGFVEARRRGSHIIMQKSLHNHTINVPVPNHKELRIGTLKGIIRQSKLPASNFEA